MFQQVALELGHFFPYEQWLCACVGVACVGVHAWVWHVCLQA